MRVPSTRAGRLQLHRAAGRRRASCSCWRRRRCRWRRWPRSASARWSCAATLREMRTAIDKFKDAVDMGQIPDDRADAGQRGLPARPRDAGRGRDGGQRRVGPQAEVPAPRAHRSDDQLHGVGAARVSGQARRSVVGRQERVRRVHEEPRARRSTARNTGTGRWTQRARPRLARVASPDVGLHADGDDDRDGAHRHRWRASASSMYGNSVHAGEGSDAQGRPVPDARRDRSVLRRQEQVPADARVAGRPRSTCGRFPWIRSRRAPTPGRRRCPSSEPGNLATEPGIFDVKSGSE